MQIRTAHYFQYSFFYANKSEDLLVNLFWLLENLWKSDLKESIIPGWKSNILKCHLECLHIISNSSTYFYSLITSKFPELWFWQVNLVYSEVNWSLSFCSRKHNTGYKIPDKIGLTYTICIFFKCIFFCEDWCKPRVQVCYIKLYLRGKKKSELKTLSVAVRMQSLLSCQQLQAFVWCTDHTMSLALPFARWSPSTEI